MLTPKQQILLKHPNIQLLIDAFQAEPTTSQEFKFSKQVSDRITNWTNDFQKAISLPVVKRTVSVEGQTTTLGQKIDPGANTEVTFTFKAWACMAGKTSKAPF